MSILNQSIYNNKVYGYIYILYILNIWIILYITVLFDMSSLHLGHTNAILRSKLSVPSFWTQEFQPTKWEIWWIWSVSFVMHDYIGWFHLLMDWITCCLRRPVKGYLLSTITHRMPRAKRKPWLQNCSSMSLGAILDRKVNACSLGWSHDPKETTIIFDFKNLRIYIFNCQSFLDVIFNAMFSRKLHHSCALHSLQ